MNGYWGVRIVTKVAAKEWLMECLDSDKVVAKEWLMEY